MHIILPEWNKKIKVSTQYKSNNLYSDKKEAPKDANKPLETEPAVEEEE